jgi:hypothetical protein
MRSSVVAATLALLIPMALMMSPLPISYSSSTTALTNSSSNGEIFTTDSTFKSDLYSLLLGVI